jgi:prefoldin beta subunit
MMSEEMELSPQIQEQLARLQQLQQTLQAVSTQKQQLEIESSETDRAMAELEKLGDQSVVYKSVGSLLLRSEKQTLTAELKERKELIGTRITVLGRQEERTKERIKELQEKLQERLRPSTGSSN